jgi:transcriptional regulator with XRE-family HTH domain
MQIGKKIKTLRLKNELTQEELGSRTDLSKGFISQLERDMNSPSIETLFSLLEVLGTTPKEFFTDAEEAKLVFKEEDHTVHIDREAGYEIDWLVPTSNKKEMEPVYLTLSEHGKFKTFEPSTSETFVYVLKGQVQLDIGSRSYIADAGDSIYYSADHDHTLLNPSAEQAEMIIIATKSYL